jgi:signal transduction histidine kinase
VRSALFRSTLITTMLAVFVAGVPGIAVAYLLALGSPVSATVGIAYVGGAAVLWVVAVLLSLVQARRYASRLSEPLQRLALQAERLGAGDARHEPVNSGIEEIDRVSRVLQTSAQELVSSLSSERDFASDASHQLRTPLTALLMRLEEIAATDDLEVAREEATIAIEQVERLNGTVDDLLSRARQTAQKRPDSVSLDSVLAALQREWHPAFGAAHRSIHVTGERGLRVLSTAVALSQVLSTLVENSLAHGRGTVRIDARRSGPSVVVEVSDQGKGIDPALAPHIFERSVSTKSTGLGLGLARDVAESHGGRLELVQGQPAVFALFLSAAEDA